MRNSSAYGFLSLLYSRALSGVYPTCLTPGARLSDGFYMPQFLPQSTWSAEIVYTERVEYPIDTVKAMRSSRNTLIPYPNRVVHLMLRMPMIFYRLGLGDLLNAIHLMVLTTRGRKSGQPRHIPVEYRRHGSKIYLISVWGERPDWYQNLIADPLATVQLGRRQFSALADPVTDPAEALRAVHLFRRIAPSRYDAVLGRLIEEDVNPRTLPDLSSQFTILRLTIIPDEPVLPGIPVSLAWVWPVALVAVLGAVVFISLARRSEVERNDS
jgi:deazaflavin-dependent oxidoreductase (nitroreductase family)